MFIFSEEEQPEEQEQIPFQSVHLAAEVQEEANSAQFICQQTNQ
jgi:hypothetical protein